MITNYDVTIGTSVFNVEKYIRKSILSALIEICVVNDDSTDKSIDIIRDLQCIHQYGSNVHYYVIRDHSLSNLQGRSSKGIINIIAK